MGFIQNAVDRFYMTIGKTEKVYPVQVEKHRIQGQKNPSQVDENVNITAPVLDRGRTLIDDQGNKKFELMNEPHAEGLVKYEDFNQDLENQPFVSVLMIDRETFVPGQRSWNFDDSFEGSYVSELEYVLKTPRMKEMAVNQFEEDSKIVETNTEKWWQQPKIQSAILFVGAGVFFILAGFAQGELYFKEIGQKLGENTEALNALKDTVANQVGGS